MDKKVKQTVKGKERLLNRQLLTNAKRFKNDLLIRIPDKQKRVDIYIDFLDMLIEGQNIGKSFLEIVPDYSELLSDCVLNGRVRSKIGQGVMRRRKPLIMVLSVFMVVLIVTISLLLSGQIGIWVYGIGHMYNNPNYLHTATKIDDIIEFEVDVSGFSKENWKSKSIGKEIYSNLTDRIIITDVICSSTTKLIDGIFASFPVWEIRLKSYGSVNYNSGRILTNFDYDMADDLSDLDCASASFSIGDKTYHEYTNTENIIYQNFVEFSFFVDSYYLNYSTYNLGEIEDWDKFNEDRLNKADAMYDTEIAALRLENMVLNQWARKTPKSVSWVNIEADGIANIATTTQLTLTFDKELENLSIDNIFILGGTKENLSGNGKVWVLSISQIISNKVTVTIMDLKNKTLFPISKTATVYRQLPITAIESDLAQNITEITLFEFICSQSGWYEFYSFNENMTSDEFLAPYCNLYNHEWELLDYGYNFRYHGYFEEGKFYYLLASVGRFDNDFLGGSYCLMIEKREQPSY